MCSEHGKPNCSCPHPNALSTLKRAIRMDQDERVQNPQTGGTMRSENATGLAPTFVAESWVPTNEQLDQALNGRNPPSRIPARPGRSGSSGIFRAFLTKSMPKVSAEESEYASRWSTEFERLRQNTTPLPSVPVTRRALECPDLREEVESECPECESVKPGEICTCELGAVDARLLTPAPRHKVLRN